MTSVFHQSPDIKYCCWSEFFSFDIFISQRSKSHHPKRKRLFQSSLSSNQSSFFLRFQFASHWELSCFSPTSCKTIEVQLQFRSQTQTEKKGKLDLLFFVTFRLSLLLSSIFSHRNQPCLNLPSCLNLPASIFSQLCNFLLSDTHDCSLLQNMALFSVPSKLKFFVSVL